MAVQMQGVCIICAVTKDQTVTSSLLQEEFTLVRIGFSVDQPGVELTGAAGDLLENHLDGLVRRYRVLVDFAENGVVPDGSRGHPLGLAVLVLIFHDHTQPSVPDSLFCRAQDPYSRLV